MLWRKWWQQEVGVEPQLLGVMVLLVVGIEPAVVDPEVLLLVEEEVGEELVVVDQEEARPVEEEIQGIRTIQIRIQSQI